MRRAFLALAMLSIAVAVGCRPPDPPAKPMVLADPHASQTLGEVVSKDGGFKVKFPGQPTKKTDTGPDRKPSENYSLQTNDRAFVVGFSYPPIPKELINEATIAGGLDGAAQAFVRETKGQFTQKTVIRLDEFQGLEFHSKTTGATPKDSGVTKGRVYWVDGRLIRVVAIGQPHWIESKEVTDFFESFSLTKAQ